jgi:hypothetical protein
MTAFADFVGQINSNSGNAQERSRDSVSILLYRTSLFPASLVETYRIRGNIVCMEEETTVDRDAAKRAEVANLKEFEKQCVAFPFCRPEPRADKRRYSKSATKVLS